MDEFKLKIKNLLLEKKINVNIAQNIDLNQLIDYFQNYELNLEYSDCLVLCNLAPFDKELLIDYFVDDIKIKARKKNCISIYDLLFTENNYLDSILIQIYNDIQSSKIKRLDGIVLRDYIYYNKICKEISHFSISVSISVYKNYGVKKILDPCIGWGERLMGALFSDVDEYFGFDPSLELHKKYNEMYYFVKERTKCKTNIYLYNMPFEEENFLKKEYFDIVFTSPPFFDQEIYTDDNTQAYNKYDNIYSFNINFIKILLLKSIKSLKSGGYLIMYYPLDFKFIDEILTFNNMYRCFPIFCVRNKNKINRFLTYRKY